MTRIARHLATLVLALMAVACGEGRVIIERPQTGRPAPAFQALAMAGDSVSLESLRGAPVLLNLWATWCAPCRKETPYLQSLHERFAPQGLRVVGVSVDAFGARRDVEEFMTEFGVTYQILHDPAMRSMDVFVVMGLPASFLIGRDGTVLWMDLGPVETGNPELEQAITAALASAGSS